MKRLALMVCAIAFVTAACGCAKSPAAGGFVAAGKPTAASSPRTPDPALVSAVNAFGFDLLGRRDGTNPGAVTVISPVSVHAALAMAANGADGPTLAEMRKTLHLDSMKEADSNLAYADLISWLTSKTDVQLDIANSLWLDKGFPAKQDFLTTDARYFGAELRTLELHEPSGPKTINEWVKKNTGGRIDQIVADKVPDLAVLELLNATYFKADWETPFEHDATHKEPFHLLDGSTADVDMLTGTESWAHVMNADYEAIALPYAGGVASMIVVQTSPLSSRGAGAPELTADQFEQLRSQLQTVTLAEGSLMLPKVELEWTGELADDLKALGMPMAFDGGKAGFSRLTDVKPAWIGAVTHKTYLRVDEKGTEAAAATKVEMMAGSAMADPPFQMVVDSPYLIAVVDSQSGAVLFLATIRDPRGK